MDANDQNLCCVYLRLQHVCFDGCGRNSLVRRRFLSEVTHNCLDRLGEMAIPLSHRRRRGVNLYGYVRNNPVNAVDPLGLRDYTAAETSQILDSARRDAQAGPLQGLVNLRANHEGGGKYDFKLRNRDDTFSVAEHTLSPASFGNYTAGYAGASYAPVGFLAMRAAGIMYDMADGGPTWFDNDGSSDDINWGARDAALRDLADALGSIGLLNPCPVGR